MRFLSLKSGLLAAGLAIAATSLPGSVARADASPVVARVGSRVITAADLERRIAGVPIFQLRGFGHTPEEVRKNFLDRVMVREILFSEGAADANAVLQVLFGVEEGAAATYLQALGQLESRDVAGPAGTILPVEGQHATAIGSLLGLPVDEWMPPFQTTDGSYAG